MHYFFFDASALVNRYHQERGSEIVNYLSDALLDSSPERLVISPLMIGEVVSVLGRKRNEGRLPPELFSKAAARVLFEARTMDRQSVDDETILRSIPYIIRHNLNATDALHLYQAVQFSELLKSMEHDLVIVASDRRLLRAGAREELPTLNPEEASLTDAQALLNN